MSDTKTLYLTRHGQTMFNLKGLIQGWCDSPLTELGQEQAATVGEYFRRADIAFDHAYASTLTRTNATIERIVPGMPYDRELGLREWFFGEFEAERWTLMPARPWRDFFAYFGGETQLQVRARMTETLADIMRRPGHERVLAVSSASAIKEFTDGVLGDAADECGHVPPNCSTSVFEFDGGAFHLVKILTMDDYAAL